MKRIDQQKARLMAQIETCDSDDDTLVPTHKRAPKRCSNCHNFKTKSHTEDDCVKCVNFETCPTEFERGHPKAMALKKMAALNAKIEELKAAAEAKAKERERRKLEKEMKKEEKEKKRKRASFGRVSAPIL